MARNMKLELLTFSLILYQSKNCGHRIHVLFMMYDVYWYCQMKKKRLIMEILKKEWFIWKFGKKGVVEKRGGGEETKSMPHALVSYTPFCYICVIRCKMCSWFRYNYQFCPNLVWWIWVGRKHSTSSYLSTILMRWTRWSIDLTSYAKVHHKLMSKNLSFMCRRCDILHSREVV